MFKDKLLTLHKKMNYYKLAKRLLVIASVLFLFSFIYKYFGIGEYVTKDNLQSLLLKFGPWVPFVYILLFTFGMGLNLPAWVFFVSIGTILGPAFGIAVAFAGCMFSSLVIFPLAKKIGSEAIQKKLGKNWEVFNEKIERHGLLYIVLIRATFIFPFGLACYAAGITKIKFKDFMVGTMLGCIPVITFHSYIVQFFINPSNFNSQNILIMLGILSVWSLFMYKTYLKNKGQFSFRKRKVCAT